MNERNHKIKREKLIAELEKLETAAIADVLVAMGLDNQVVSSAISALSSDIKMVGIAACAKGNDNPATEAKPVFDLDRCAYPDSIMVIDTDNCNKGAIIGDNMVASMMKRGCRGFLVDGGIRDASDFIKDKTPVFSRYTSPVSAHKYWHFTDFETPVRIAGIWGDVTVHPGDYVLGDRDGIVVIPANIIEQVIADGQIHMDTENSIKAAILKGVDRETVTKKAGRLKHVKKLNGKK